MNLCYIAPTPSPHTTRWLRAFVERGHQVHLLVIPGETAEIEGVSVHPLPPGSPKLRFAHWVWAAHEYLNQIQPDVLHAHYLTRYGWLAAFTLFRPVALTAWGTDAYIDPRRSCSARWLTAWALRRADLVTTDADDLAERMRRLGARSDRVHVVQWGVDTALFRREVDTSQLRARLGLQDGPIILCTRSLRPNYNQDVILRALAAVLRVVPTAQLVFKYSECDPEFLARLHALTAELELIGAVHFVGAARYQDLPAYYALADVFVSVASSDSTPVSLLEAMASGVAPVVSDLPAIREWIADGENGFCVPTRDENALADAMVRLAQSPELHARFARTNRDLIVRRGNQQIEMDRMETLYAGLAHQIRMPAR